MIVEPACTHAFATAADFGEWLAEHHSEESDVWLRIQKRSSGLVSVTWGEAIVEALVWGWIDGVKKANDETSWLQRFTPRTPRSIWSRINREHAETLIAEGRMQDAGFRAVVAAKSDGRWDAAYAGSSAMEFPEVFLSAIAESATAKKTFEGLKRAELYPVYYRLQIAKKEETRQRLMRNVLEKLSRGEELR